MARWYDRLTVEQRRAWVARRNPEIVRRNDRRRYRRDRLKRDELSRQSNDRHPDRRRARVAVGNAIRDGRLEKSVCEVCGDARVEAHHADYSKPLAVRWLCPIHHREAGLAVIV